MDQALTVKELAAIVHSVIVRTLIDLREPCTPSDRADARVRLSKLNRELFTMTQKSQP